MTNIDAKRKKRILVVDDEVAILRIISTSLKLMGYDVITCSQGKEALKMRETEKPDIMLLDVFMPGIGGLEILQTLRETSNMPVIVFSAHVASRDEALKRGADDFVHKPFTPEQIEKKISAVLAVKGTTNS